MKKSIFKTRSNTHSEQSGSCEATTEYSENDQYGNGSSYESEKYVVPGIGDQAPPFRAITTQGEIDFPQQYKGSWIVFFSHPADFTPVCTSELLMFASMKKEFDKIDTRLVGLSVDSVFSHIAWLRHISENIEFKGIKNVKFDFPMIEDTRMDISRLYGMLQPSASSTKTVRSVFFIDPEGVIRAIIQYPMAIGRNFGEIKRVILALQTSDTYEVATPADWKPGEDVLLPNPNTCEQAESRMATEDDSLKCSDWFFCLKKLTREHLGRVIGFHEEFMTNS